MTTTLARKILKDKGLRATRHRLAILKLCANIRQPISVEEIRKRLQSRQRAPHFTTIYRESDLLTQKEIFEKCTFFGKATYQLNKKQMSTHCIRCNNTSQVSKKSVGKISQEIHFNINTSSSHIHGICTKCAST